MSAPSTHCEGNLEHINDKMQGLCYQLMHRICARVDLSKLGGDVWRSWVSFHFEGWVAHYKPMSCHFEVTPSRAPSPASCRRPPPPSGHRSRGAGPASVIFDLRTDPQLLVRLFGRHGVIQQASFRRACSNIDVPSDAACNPNK